ncbi:hypothetical protein F7725_025885 [Dissostichus mawsoni]|uniref:SV2A/B/C luminal domain-containing protein n=1 Tax=Dissostichus mawsoni TaxID=36200 RepID=A0A7J5X5H6_DISMA|nr:hypothetical protein F7725_025885 [Dissostichus mawsoni]
MQYEEYESKVRVFHRERVERFHFNFSLVNQIHREGEYIHDKSTNTFFENCTIRNTVFYNTDLWEDKFKDCKMENTTFLHPKKGCHLNFLEENDIVIYMVSFLGSLAVLPGNIPLLCGSMLASAACTFLLLLSFSQGAVICWQCLFYGTSVAAWNGLQVISVELYPSAKSFIFAKFIGITKIVPIFLAFASLVCGGLVALKLPETREKILQ